MRRAFGVMHAHYKLRSLPWRLAAMFAASLAIAIIWGCASTIEEQSGHSVEGAGGQALDRQTGLPLEGVHVVARYVHSDAGPGHSQQVCARVEYMVTGADGYYRFSADPDGTALLDFYKRGYAWAPSPNHVEERAVDIEGKRQVLYAAVLADLTTGKVISENSYVTLAEARRASGLFNVYLKRYDGSRAERFQSLWSHFGTNCLQAGEMRAMVVPFLSAVYSEMEATAQSQQELGLLARAKDIIDMERVAR